MSFIRAYVSHLKESVIIYSSAEDRKQRESAAEHKALKTCFQYRANIVFVEHFVSALHDARAFYYSFQHAFGRAEFGYIHDQA